VLLIVVSIVACAAIGADHAENTALQPVHWRTGLCLATGIVSLFVSQSLPNNGSIRRNIILSTLKCLNFALYYRLSDWNSCVFLPCPPSVPSPADHPDVWWRIHLLSSPHPVSRDSSAVIARGLRAGRPGFDSRQRQKILFYSTAFRPALGSTQPSVQWASGAPSMRIKQGREVYHSLPSSVVVKNGGAIPPLSHMSSGRDA
jgi:hypothetical protein